MKKYQIALHGCDDSTYFEMELTPKQLELVNTMKELADKSSTYGCQPTMEIKEVK